MALPSNGAHYMVIRCGCECGVHIASPHKQPSLRVLSSTETLHFAELKRTNITGKNTKGNRETRQMVQAAMTRARKRERKDSFVVSQYQANV